MKKAEGLFAPCRGVTRCLSHPGRLQREVYLKGIALGTKPFERFEKKSVRMPVEREEPCDPQGREHHMLDSVSQNKATQGALNAQKKKMTKRLLSLCTLIVFRLKQKGRKRTRVREQTRHARKNRQFAAGTRAGLAATPGAP